MSWINRNTPPPFDPYWDTLPKDPPLFKREVQQYKKRDTLVLILLGPFTVGITWAMLFFNE
jgi:hypothetical protein